MAFFLVSLAFFCLSYSSMAFSQTSSSSPEAPPIASTPIPYAELKKTDKVVKTTPARRTRPAFKRHASLLPTNETKATKPNPSQVHNSDNIILPSYASQPLNPAVIEAFSDSVVRAMMQRDHILGVSIAIVQGETPLLIKGYGYDRLSPNRPVDPNTSLFRLGSISKTFTWIVARQEIEAGRIDLDKPLSNYLPSEVYSEDRRFSPLRMRDLMTHSEGFDDTQLGHIFQLDAGQIENSDAYFLRHRPRRVRDRALFSSYSNFGAALAARAVVQSARAHDVPSLMQDRIFTPLGLNHTTLREPYEQGLDSGLPSPMSASLKNGLSDGFIWNGSNYINQAFEHSIGLSGAIGASGTASDMARYMSLLLNNGTLNGVQLFDARSALAFRQPMMKVPQGFNGWASGFEMRKSPQGLQTFGHSGSTLWFSNSMILVPELNLGIYIATNTQTGEALTDSYPNLLMAHLKGNAISPPLTMSPTRSYVKNEDYYKRFTGHYVSSRRSFSGLEGAITRLINTLSINFHSDGRMLLKAGNHSPAYTSHANNDYFTPQIQTANISDISSQTLHFIKTQNGQVLGFESASNMERFERVGWIHKPTTLGNLSLVMLISCLLCLVSLGRAHNKINHPTPEQIRASWVSYATAILWILAISVFSSWKQNLGNDPISLFTQWPSGQVRLASVLAFLASVASLFQLGTLFWVFKEAYHYNDGWADWQKITHSLQIILWTLYSFVLMAWGALEFWSW